MTDWQGGTGAKTGGNTIFAKISSGFIHTKDNQHADAIRPAATEFFTHDKDGKEYPKLGLATLYGTIQGFSLESGYQGTPEFKAFILSDGIMFKIAASQTDFIMQNVINVALKVCENNCELEFSVYVKKDKNNKERTRLAIRKKGQNDTLKGKIEFEKIPQGEKVSFNGKTETDYTKRIDFHKKMIEKINDVLKFDPNATTQQAEKPLPAVDMENLSESEEIPF